MPHALPDAEPAAEQAVVDGYRQRAAAHTEAARRARTQERRLSWARLAAFGTVALFAGWAISAPEQRAALGGVAALALAAFALLVSAHGRAVAASVRRERLRDVCEQGAHRVRRDWNALPAPPEIPVSAEHPYAVDLDIVGHASLLALLDVVSAAPGRPTLLAWLLEAPPDAPALRARQAAVRELAPMHELRELLSALGRAARAVRPEELERFLEWAERPPWLMKRPLLLWVARLLPAAIVAAAVAQRVGAVDGPLWLVPVLLGLALTAWARRALGETLGGAARYATGLRGHAAMMAHLSDARFESSLLRAIQARLDAGGGARGDLGGLERAMRLAEVRYSGMLYAVLQLLLLWDFHVVWRLERWQARTGARLRDWLRALGEAEALGALATLAHDNPRWPMPSLEQSVGGPPLVEAAALGHPLIAAVRRVANDVTVGPPGAVLLVTGSNMSGKSTLLRAIGLNVVLAQAGGPVCARSMRLPLVAPWTSMRVQDSIEIGVSLFMAELRRLRQIVDAARAAAAAAPHSPPVLYLLDEILHGTNTAERRIAVRTVIGHLLRLNAIGAVTSHDLALADEGPLAHAAHPVHFRESFEEAPAEEGARMTFDYLLRPGLATSANALALLRMLGLGEAGGHEGQSEGTPR